MQNVLSIARYEFLLHWRGRSMRVIALTMLLVTCAGVLIWNSAPEGQLNGLLNMNEPAFSVNVILTFLTFPALIVLIGFVMPVAASETIPADKHYKTVELLNSLPVTNAQYLGGKLLGYWFAGISALIAVFVINAILWWVVLRSYSLGSYIELWIVSGIVLIINTGIAILIAGTQPNRIRAAALIICIFILSTLLLENTSDIQGMGSISSLANLSRAQIITYYINQAGTENLRLASPQVLMSIVVGIVELTAVFAASWFWRRQSE